MDALSRSIIELGPRAARHEELHDTFGTRDYTIHALAVYTASLSYGPAIFRPGLAEAGRSERWNYVYDGTAARLEARV